MTEPYVMDWPYVESDMDAWRSWAGKETKMDTDVLLQRISVTKNQVTGWQDVVEANTGALREIRLDLGHCNNQEKVQAIINKVEMALEDLNVNSQKIPGWLRAENKDGTVVQNPNAATVYGQYPIYQPLNPDNPVAWPPGYTPDALQTVEGVKAEPEPQTAKGKK